MCRIIKVYRYKLGMDTIIERVDEVKLINDKLYIDEGDDYPKFVCAEYDLNSGNYVMDWEECWLCYNEPQNEVDIKCDFSRLMKEKLHHLRKEVSSLNSKITMLETDIEMIGEWECEREDNC